MAKLDKDTLTGDTDRTRRRTTGELVPCGHLPAAVLLTAAKTSLATVQFEAARADHDEASVVTARRSLRRIMRVAHRIERLLGDLCDLGDAEIGKLRLERKKLDLSRVVNHVLDTLIAETRKLVRFDVREVLHVHGDAERLERVVGTLIDNAIGRAIDAEVLVRLDRRAELAVLTISDHGLGMTAEQVLHAFDPRAPATGMPLYVAKRIIEAHGGRLGVESVPAKGTVFTIELVALKAQTDPRT